MEDHTAAPVLRCVLVELRVMVDSPEEPEPAFWLVLRPMPAQEFPRLSAVAPGLAEHGGPESLAAGDALLDRFIAGT